MKPVSRTDPFQSMDVCHQMIQQHLADLATLIPQFETASDTVPLRQQVGAIETFFSSTSRQHHAEEELKVFPALLTTDNAELLQAVHTLQQDHGWIEQNWLELSPMLRAIAQGEDWVDQAELVHMAKVFMNLCNEHIALEESLIYPAAKNRLAQDLAARTRRLSQ